MFKKDIIYFALLLTTAMFLPFVLHDNLFHLLFEGCHLHLLIKRKQMKSNGLEPDSHIRKVEFLHNNCRTRLKCHHAFTC